MPSDVNVKYSVGMIVRNCASDLDRCLSSLEGKPDEIVVVNTAIYENESGCVETSEVARKHGAKVYHFPWIHDFAAARNFCFSKCSNDVVMWLDSDDVVSDADSIDKNIRIAFKDGRIDGLFMEYLYEFDKNNNCTTMLPRERVVNRNRYEWRAPIHEVLCAKIAPRTTNMPPEVGRIIHVRQAGDEAAKRKSLIRNKKVFEEQFEKKGIVPDLRMLFYWANTSFGLGDIAGAADQYEDYLRRCKDEGNQNYGEMYVALWSLCEAYRQLGQMERAAAKAGEAIIMCPRSPTAYVHMAECLLHLRDYDRAIVYAYEAKSRSQNIAEEMVSNPKCVNGLPAFITARACYAKQMFPQALAALEESRKFYGEEQEFLAIENQCRIRLAQNAEEDAFKRVRQALMRDKKFSAVHSLCLNAPDYLQASREIAAYLPKRRPQDKLSIAFICPDSGIDFVWGPDSIANGIGGSEEAVINAANDFARRGWHVEVYCNTGKTRKQSPILSNGVEWWPEECWTGKQDTPLDVAIWWRAPRLKGVLGSPAKKNYLWLHDIFVPESWSHDSVDQYDGVLLLSKYHRDLHKVVPEEKVIYSANGIDPDLLVPEEELTNEPHRLVWGSDPSRGLQDLLPWWEMIREAVPDATLDIYYGWSPHYLNMMKGSKWHRDVHAKVEDLKDQPGITWHGKVGQDELNKAYARSGVWAYATGFPEIHCISALKAQAHGAAPIVPDQFALSETVQFGDKLPGPLSDSAKMCALVERVIWRLKNPLPDKERKEMIRWARSKTWEAVVDGWLSAFKVEPRAPIIEPVMAASLT